MAIVEPLQNLVIDDIIAQLAKVTTNVDEEAGPVKSSLLGTDDIAIILSPREPDSVADEPQSNGDCLVYDLADGRGEGGSTVTEVRDFTVQVELRALAAKSVNVRRLLRRAWGQATQVICAGYGQRVQGVSGIEAGDVVIVPDDDGNAAIAFIQYVVTLEHVRNDPTDDGL